MTNGIGRMDRRKQKMGEKQSWEDMHANEKLQIFGRWTREKERKKRNQMGVWESIRNSI